MAYVPLSPAQIEIGQPTKKELFQQISDNLDSFNTDIEALKQTSTIDIFNIVYTGKINQYSQTEIDESSPVYKAPVGATMTSFVVTLLSASTSGNLEVDIEKSIDNGVNWTPLLTSSVTVTGITTGSVSGSVNWVDVASQSFDQNDLLRLRINGIQVNQGDFQISIYGEVS